MADSVQLLGLSKPWHEELATFLIKNPHLTMGQVARSFNVSASWLSVVKNSDAFKDYYDARRAEVQSMVSATLADKVNALAELGVEQLTEHVVDHANGAEMGMDALMGVTDLALKSLGFGGRGGNAPAPAAGQTLVVIGDQEALKEARKTLQVVREHVIDAELVVDGAKDATPGHSQPQGETIEHEGNTSTSTGPASSPDPNPTSPPVPASE